MKLISLTLRDGGIVYLNAEYITAFFQTRKKTFVYDTNATEPWEVYETPEEIIELIKNSYE